MDNMSKVLGVGPSMSRAKSTLGSASRHPRHSLPRLVLGLLLAVIGAVVLALLVDLRGLVSAAQVLTGRPLLLAALLATYTGAFWLRAVAWRRLATSPVSTYSLFTVLQAALLINHLLPFKLGEVARPILAARRGMPFAEAVATTGVARILDLSALIVVAAVMGSLLPLDAPGEGWARLLVAPAALATALAAGLVAVRSRSMQIPLMGPLRSRIDALRTQLRLMSVWRLVGAAALTAPSWVLEAGVLIVAANALGTELSVMAAIAITAFTIVFQIFHVTPGGIGVYEASMTGALLAVGMSFDDALALAVFTHGLKFAYSYTVGLLFAVVAAREFLSVRWAFPMRGSSDGTRSASRTEILAARAWNVLNEGKPFTPVFTVGVIVLLSLPHIMEPGHWLRSGAAMLALVPLFVVFYRFDFPLKLRAALWAYIALFLVGFRFFDIAALSLMVGLYLTFTVVLWGTVYYRLRIGTPWTNFTRFWRLVLENPDPTSGNFLEQVPKVALLVLAFQMLVQGPGFGAVLSFEIFVLGIGVTALLLHQWFFNWPPAPALAPTRLRAYPGERRSRRFIAIVIDGCRADRLAEATTPFIDRLRREGADYTNTATVYPARTVTGFSSMLTGAPPKIHGMRSNFVPSLGVKCESVFDSLRSSGRKGKLVGIAHLVDAFGERDVETVTAVTDNDEIDYALVSRARSVMDSDDPDLLVLQLLSVDQTGHARGSYNDEYLAKIEESDRIIEEFLGWCERRGYLQDATVLITSDHGQGIGIGGHGHMSRSETYVPCIMWGKGVELSGPIDEPRSVMDVAPTIAYYLGVQPPGGSVGQVLGVVERGTTSRPVAVVVPAHNEAENLSSTLAEIPRSRVPDLKVVVVDDGSTDGTAEIARRCGADVVVRHECNRGLGAALRTGLAAAREMDARAAVYVDADGEYPPAQIPDLLAPIEADEADYVLGSRYLGSRDGQTLSRFIANKLFTAMLCVASGRLISDGQTGFRAFSRRALECAEIIHDYNYAQVLTLDLLKKGMKLREVPIHYRRRANGTSFIGPRYLWRVPLAMVKEMLST